MNIQDIVHNYHPNRNLPLPEPQAGHGWSFNQPNHQLLLNYRNIQLPGLNQPIDRHSINVRPYELCVMRNARGMTRYDAGYRLFDQGGSDRNSHKVHVLEPHIPPGFVRDRLPQNFNLVRSQNQYHSFQPTLNPYGVIRPN